MSEFEDEMKKGLEAKCEDFILKFKELGVTDKEANMFAKGYLMGVSDGINLGQQLANSGMKVETNIDLKKEAKKKNE